MRYTKFDLPLADKRDNQEEEEFEWTTTSSDPCPRKLKCKEAYQPAATPAAPLSRNSQEENTTTGSAPCPRKLKPKEKHQPAVRPAPSLPRHPPTLFMYISDIVLCHTHPA